MIANLKAQANFSQIFGSKQVENVKPQITHALPPDLIVMIFSNLDLASVGVASCVNKEWKQLLEDDRDHPPIWKIAIYRELAFGNDKWAQCFGQEVIAGELAGEDFATLPFEEVIRDYRNIENVFLGKKAREALMLVRVPKTLNGELTLKTLGKLAARWGLGDQNNPNNKGYRCIWDAVLNQLGDAPITESRWVLMTKDILPGSRCKSYAEQQNLVNALAAQGINGYAVPRVLEGAVCILAQYFILNMRLFSDNSQVYIRSQESLNGHQVVIGGVVPSGFNICNLYYSDLDCSFLGVAPLREFSVVGS